MAQTTLQDFVTIFYLDLEQTFLKAKALFNQQTPQAWTELEKLLDPDVILNKVDDPVGNQSVVGIADVMNYLRTKVTADKPQFIPNPINVYPRTGTVSGKAIWVDHDNGKETKRPITYSFVFTLRKPKDAPRQWFIVNMYGSPD